MAAFDKKIVLENVRGIFLSIRSEIILNLLNERTILFFWLEVAFNPYFKSRKQGIPQKHF